MDTTPPTSQRSPSPRDDSRPAGSARPARLPAWVRVLLPMILFLPIASAGVVLLLVPGFGELMNRMDAVGAATYGLYAAVVLAAYVLVSWALVRWVDRQPFSALGLRINGRALAAVLIGYAIAQVIALVAGWSAGALGLSRPIDTQQIEAQMAQVPVGVVIVISLLRAFVLQGIGEEVLFRGYLLQSLRRRPVLGVLIAAIVFTAPHLASSGGQQSAVEHVMYLAIPFGFAISAGFLAIALGSVWAAVGIHGGFHLATSVAAMVGLGADGPGAWVLLGAGHLVAGAVVALCIPRHRWAEVREHGPYAARARA